MIKWIKKRMNERTSWDGARAYGTRSDDIVLCTTGKNSGRRCYRLRCMDNLEIRVIKNWV